VRDGLAVGNAVEVAIGDDVGVGVEVSEGVEVAAGAPVAVVEGSTRVGSRVGLAGVGMAGVGPSALDVGGAVGVETASSTSLGRSTTRCATA